ncbi:MAG: S8 family serine peptidase [Actinomycetota bacterium]
MMILSRISAVVVGLALLASAGPAAAFNQWNLDQAGATSRARELGHAGAGITVAVIDTWVDATHPDLAGRVLPVIDLTGLSDSGKDRCWHGTHVAGIIAASGGLLGVAPAVQVLPIRVLAYDPDSGDCSGDSGIVARGIRDAADRGARVINLSLGALLPLLFQDSAVRQAVDYAYDKGAVVVFAAGNSSIPLTDTYGSRAILVAATGPSGRRASYSNTSSEVAVAAPGGDASTCTPDSCVVSTVPPNTMTNSDGSYACTVAPCYVAAQGTSQAAPHVAGEAALLIAQLPSRSPAEVRRLIVSATRPLAGSAYGLIDIDKALAQNAPQQESPPPAPGGTGGSQSKSPVPAYRTTSPTATPEPTQTTPEPTQTTPEPEAPAVSEQPELRPSGPSPAPVAVPIPRSSGRRVPVATAAILLAVVGGGLGASARTKPSGKAT